jgi:hypothetical protein
LRSLLPLVIAGCGSSTLTVPDAAVPLDMHITAPTTLGPAQTLTNCLAVDASFVYWSDAGPAIMKVPVAGGTPTQVVAGGDKNACVAVDGSGVYYFDADKVMKAPLTGGGAAPLASGQHLLKGAPIVAAGGYVYWVTDVYGNVDAFNGMYAIVRVSTTAAAATPEIVTATLVGNPGGLAVDDTNVYYSDQSGVFARALAAPATATSFGQSFRTDGMMRVVVSPSLAQPLAVDDRGVYINGSGSLERLALDGAGAMLLATQPPRAVALSATTIFFTDGSAIYSLPK